MADLSPRVPGLRSWQALSLLFLSTLLLFYPFLSPSSPFVLSKMNEDMTGQFVWWRQFGFDQLRQGHLALWNPHLFCGEPFLGGFQSALFYPPNWLFMVLPLPLAINSSIALHVFLAGAFTYLWMRIRGTRPVTALMAALMYMFGASMILHIIPGHLPNLCTMAWIPLVFMSVDVCHLKEDRRWIFLGMFAVAMQIFSGHVQYVYYTAVTLGLYTVYLLFQIEKKAAFIGKLAALALGGGLLAAVQLLTGWAAQSESARSTVMDMKFIDIGNTNPERFWCLLMPDFFNGWRDYWGGGFYWEGEVFISVTGFALALLALVWSRDRQKWFFSALALFLMVVSVGGRTVLFKLLYLYFPLFSHFRGVAKFNIFITLFLVVVAAIGMEEVFQKTEKLRQFKTVLWRTAGIFLGLALFFYITPLLGGERLFKRYAQYTPGMAESLARCAVTLFVLGFLAERSVRKRQWLYGFLVLVFVEMFFFAHANLPFFNLDSLKKITQTIDGIYQKDPGDYRIYTGSNNYTLGTSHSSAWGDDPFVPERYQQFMDLTKTLTPYSTHFDYPLANYSKALALTRLQYSVYLQNGTYVVQKLDLPRLPRAFLVGNWAKAPLESIWPQILSPSFDPLKKVWTEQDPGIATSTALLKGQIELKDLSTDAVEVRVQTNRPTILVLTDSYSQSWKAKAYEPSVQNDYSVLPVNGFQMGVPLQKGSHHFYLEYRPTAFIVGAWISWISWALFIGCFFVTIPMSRRP